MTALRILLFSCSTILLSSCEFRCSVGEKKKDEPAVTTYKNGIRVSNDINLDAYGVVVEKAYLLFKDGTAVPAGNIVDFTQPVRLVLVFDKGWTEENDRVSLGVSEKIEAESGEVLLDEKDLFAAQDEKGISATDAKQITITATIILRKDVAPLTTFKISFRVWDKKGDAYVQGSYKLYSK